MPPSVPDKALIGVAAAAGTGVLAWQTQFPWIEYDIQVIQVRTTPTGYCCTVRPAIQTGRAHVWAVEPVAADHRRGQ